jgi:FkbM family methyltransferase
MSIKSRAANIASRIGSVEPVLAGIRAAKVPAWQARSDHDDRHMRAILAAVLSENSNAIDVGAASGTILADIVRIAPHGRHVALEPRADAALLLAANYPSVEVHQTAASNASGTATFTVVDNVPELSGLQPRPWPHHELHTRVETVVTEALDDVITQRVDVIKVDVEGAELACLQGAQRLLAEFRPVVLFEHGGTAEGDPDEAEHLEIWRLLTRATLRVFTIDGDGPLSGPAFAAASSSGTMWNFVARAA